MTIDSMDVTLLTGLIFIAATLYSSVGHGGASGYLAAMAFFTVPAAVMKPTALLLNVLVSGIGVVRFYRFKLLRLQNLWPFIVGSIPCAFIGGGIHLPESFYRPLLGAVLLAAAANQLWRRKQQDDLAGKVTAPRGAAIASGSAIGLLSGLTGTGGGIFLSPLMLILRWAGVREVAAMAAGFIFVNSIAGLAGNLTSLGQVPQFAVIWVVAAFLGGLTGSWLAARRLSIAGLRTLLALVLVVAGGKLLFT